MPTEKQIAQSKKNLEKGKKTQFSGERAAKMAKRSAEVRQKKAEEKITFQEAAQWILHMPLHNGKPVVFVNRKSGQPLIEN